MLRQLRLRAPITGLPLKRSLTIGPRQIQKFVLVEAAIKEPQNRVRSTPGRHISQLFNKMAPQITTSTSLTLGVSKLRIQLPNYAMTNNFRQYTESQNALDQLQKEPGKVSRTKSVQVGFSEVGGEPSSGVALVPVEEGYVEQSIKEVGPTKPQPETKIIEQPMRKIPYYNPLRRRSNVDPARVQYIKDRFKERNMENETYKPQGKKHVSRTALHSGRLDKID